MEPLTMLQRRIIAALQIDGRASWSKIAEAIGEPARTVARSGAELLEGGEVIVAAMQHSLHQFVLAGQSSHGLAALNATAMSQRPDVVFCYTTTGSHDLVAEVGYGDDLSALVLEQLPATVRLRRSAVSPVLKYFKTVRGWRTGALTLLEARALSDNWLEDSTEPGITTTRAVRDAELVRLLREDGRASLESLARSTKMSETSVARRISWLLEAGYFSIRALVEPARVGFPVEALLWVRVRPGHTETLGRQLASWQSVRYAAALAGKWQLLVNITTKSHQELYQILSNPVWSTHTHHVRADQIVTASKRGNRARIPS